MQYKLSPLCDKNQDNQNADGSCYLISEKLNIGITFKT